MQFNRYIILLLLAMVLILPCSIAESMVTAGNELQIGTTPIIIISDNRSPIEDQAIKLFMNRYLERSNQKINTVTISEYRSGKYLKNPSFVIFAGIKDKHEIIKKIGNACRFDFPSASEGYLLMSSAPDKLIPNTLPDGVNGFSVVCGIDSRGLLYGLGRYLRQIDYDGMTTPSTFEDTHPAVKDRGVYLAIHFRNCYEIAPMSDIRTYIEDCALWGFNTVYTLFGIGGYPRGAGKDPKSYVYMIATRIKKINEIARSLGMKTGFIGEANEGWIFYPELKAVKPPSSTHPYGTICASKPEGLKLILDYRREVLDLIGPIDEFCLWPYDSGGCACDQCSDEHGWTKTYLKIGPKLADVVKEMNPNAKVILSTWLMDDAERKLVYDQCDKGARWFDGVMMQSEYAGEHQISSSYSKFVFPEISMFGCYFTSYGCNGANPAPEKFAVQAQKTAALDYGALLYSEGIYEDFNKMIWAALLWDPTRKYSDVAEEYSIYYFGEANRKSGADLIIGLEKTWGSAQLGIAKAETVEHLYHQAEAIGKATPSAPWCKDRQLLLYYRAKMDQLMKSIGPDQAAHQQASSLYYRVRSDAGHDALKSEIKQLNSALITRSKSINDLFETYWDYLKHFHLDEITLVFRPDEFIGKVDFSALEIASTKALKAKDDKTMRNTMLKGLQRFFWTNNVDYSYF